MNKYHSIMLIALFSLSTAITQISAAPKLLSRYIEETKIIRHLEERLAGVEKVHTATMTAALAKKLNEYEDLELQDDNLMIALENCVIIDYTYAAFKKKGYWYGQGVALANRGQKTIIKKIMANEPLDTFFNKDIDDITAMHLAEIKWL